MDKGTVIVSANTVRVHQLQMFRHTRTDQAEQPSADESIAPIHSDANDCSDFFLYDYYDCLRYIDKGDNNALVYQDVIAEPLSRWAIDGYAKQVHPVLSANMCTLTDIRGDSDNNPFLNPPTNGNSYSEYPFLAVITLTIRTGFYENYGKLEPRDSVESIDAVMAKLLEIVEDKAKECVDNEGIIHAYLSVSTGDIVIAARLARASYAYKIALTFREENIFQGDWSSLTFNSFTCIATEMRVANGRYIVWDNKNTLEKNKDDIIVIRMRMNKTCMVNICNAARSSSKKSAVSVSSPLGLFGHYDVTARIPFADYMNIYHILCEYKYKPKPDKEEIARLKKQIEALKPTEYVRLIACGLINRNIQLSNERCCVWLDFEGSLEVEKPSAPGDTQWHNNIEKLRMALLVLKSKVYNLRFGHRVYHDGIQQLLALLSSYSAVGDQVESACSGYDFIVIMNTVVNSLTKNMEHLEKLHEESARRPGMGTLVENACETILDQLSRCVEDVNNHLILIYMFNLQTIQMLQYGVDSRVDGRKYVLAYMELLYQLMENHLETIKLKNGRSDPARALLPMLSVDHVSEIRAIGVFCDMSRIWQIPYPKQNNEDYLLVSISLTSLTTIIRMFDTMPALLHEIAHFRRLLPISERNEFFIDLVARNVAKLLAMELINRTSGAPLSKPPFEMQYHLSRCISRSINDVCDSSVWLHMSYRDLVDAILDYYETYLFRSRDNGSSTLSIVRETIAALCAFPGVSKNENENENENENKEIFSAAVSILASLDVNDSVELPMTTLKHMFKVLNANSKLPSFMKSKLDIISRQVNATDKMVKLTLEQLYILIYLTRNCFEGDWHDDICYALHRRADTNTAKVEQCDMRKTQREHISNEYIRIETERCVIDRRSIGVNVFSKMIPLKSGKEVPVLLALCYTVFECAFARMKNNLESLKILTIVNNGNKNDMKRGELKTVLTKYGADYIEKRFIDALTTIGAHNTNGESCFLRLREKLYDITTGFEHECGKLEKETRECLNDLRNSIGKLSGRIEDEDMRVLDCCVELIEHEMEHLLLTLTDLYQKIVTLRNIQEKNGDAVDLFEDWHRDQILSLAHERIKAEHSLYDQSQKRQLFASKNNTAIVSRLSATIHGNARFADLFSNTISSFPNARVRDIITSTNEYYSEAGSDLFMCSCMNFDAYKYFMYFEKQYFNSKNQRKFDEEAKHNREELVLSILISMENVESIKSKESLGLENENHEQIFVNANSLVLKFNEYYEKQQRKIIERAKTLLRRFERQYSGEASESLINDCLNDLDIFDEEDYTSIPLLCKDNKQADGTPPDKPGIDSVIEKIKEIIKQGDRAGENAAVKEAKIKLRCDLQDTLHLWDMVLYMYNSLLCMLLNEDSSPECGPIFYIRAYISEYEHYKNCYKEKLMGKANKMFREQSEHTEPTFDVISRWFDTSENMTDENMLRETLLFTLRYYYKHQFRIHMKQSEKRRPNEQQYIYSFL